jgi:pyruvate kinase
VNTPDSVLDISPLTPKDRSDLEYMLKIGVDWVALSFVQQPADIVEILELIDKHLPDGAFRPAVMAKIEKPSCFLDDNLERIVDLCDGISKYDVLLGCNRLFPLSCLQPLMHLSSAQWWHVVIWV